jgi:phosphomannomutase
LGGDPFDALAQASKRAIEGQWLRQYSNARGQPKQLVVGGDFSQQEEKFVEAVGDMMRHHGVKLYDLENVEPLVGEIRESAQLHSNEHR